MKAIAGVLLVAAHVALFAVALDRCARADLAVTVRGPNASPVLALDGDVLVAVEVKTRRNIAFGHPFEAVDDRKRERLWRLGYAWCRTHPELAGNRMLRLEVIGIVGPDPVDAVLEHLVDLR